MHKLVVLGITFVVALIQFTQPTNARWKAEYAAYELTPKQRAWINSAKNRKGRPCCSTADGYRPDEQDIEWSITKNKYRVRVLGSWIEVEDYQLVGPPENEPNPIGRAIVWTYSSGDGNGDEIAIRCFAPGSGN